MIGHRGGTSTLRSIGLLLLVSGAACAYVEYRYTPTGATVAARSPACDFEIITTVPQRPFRELGVLDNVGSVSTYTLPAFKDAARPLACQAGADAVIVQINGGGAYIKGTAIKYTAPGRQPGAGD